MGERGQVVLTVALVALLALPACSALSATGLSAAEIRALTDKGENEEAAEAARALLERVEAKQGSRSLQVAEALELLARALARAHQNDSRGKQERLELAERALRIRQELSEQDDVVNLAWSHYVVGLVHNLVWEPALSLGPFKEALRIAEAHFGENHPETEVYVREYGTAVYGVGRFREAFDLFERYRAISVDKHGEGHPATFPAYFNLALVNQNLGNLEEADSALQVAEKVLAGHEPNYAHKLVRVNSLRGTMLMLQGRLAESIDQYEKALRLGHELLGPEDREVSGLANFLGRALIDLGDFERANEVLTVAIRSEPPTPADYIRCSLHVNLARARHALGDLDGARTAYELFEAEASMIPSSSSKWAQFYTEYAAVLFDLDDVASARTQLDRALTIHREMGEDTLDYADTLSYQGSLNLATGAPAVARTQLEHALRIIEKAAGENQRYYVAREDLSEALYAVRENNRAFEMAIEAALGATEFDRATIALLPQRQALARAVRPRIARDIATTLVLSTNEAPASWRREAYELQLQSRAMVFDETASRQRRWADVDNPEVLAKIDAWNAARTRVANLAMMGPRANVAHYVDRFDTEQKTVERLERELAQSSPEHRDLFRRREFDLDTLRSALRQGEALVSYARYGKKTPSGRERVPHYAVAVLRYGDTAPAWFDLGTAAGLEQTVERWRAMFRPDRVEAGEAAYREIGNKLRQAVWDPIAAALSTEKTVFVVPAAAIHLVGFAGLPTANRQYLIDSGPTFHYLTAERDLLRVEDTSRVTATGLLVVGNPSFNATDGLNDSKTNLYRGSRPKCASLRSQKFGALPGTKREARIVRATRLESVSEGRGEPGHEQRLIVLSRDPVDSLLEGGRLSRALAETLRRSAISVAPLAERRDEIPGLVRAMAARFAESEGREIPRFSGDALALLWRQPWRENVRGLEGFIYKLVLSTEGEIGSTLLQQRAASMGLALRRRLPSKRPRRLDLEAALLSSRNKNGSVNKTRAARLLGWDPDTLARHLGPGGPSGD